MAQSAGQRTSKAELAPDRVGGRVVSATDGHPIPNAIVTLLTTQSRQAVASTRTDAEGGYRFDGQPVGKYSLQASAPNYLASTYQQHANFSTAIVLGAGLLTGSLTLALTPSARIHGRVLDESGDPVKNALILLYRENPDATGGEEEVTGRFVRARNLQTTDDGGFEFAGVAPGRFFLSASGVPWYATHPRPEADGAFQAYRAAIDPALDVAYPEVFYPNSLDDAGAAPIVIKGGEQVNASFALQAQRAVSVTLRLPAGEDERNRRFPTLTRTVFGMNEPVQNQASGTTGQAVTISGIAPGRYNVQTWGQGNRSVEDAGTIDLTAGSASMDLPGAGSGKSAKVQVSLHLKNGSPAGGVQLSLHLVSPSLQRSEETFHVPDSGEITLPDVPLGDYHLVLSRAGRPFHVVGLSLDGKPVVGDRLHLVAGGDRKADVTVSTFAQVIEGFAQHAGKGIGGSMVVLVPAGADMAASLYRRDQSDLDGSFTLNDVVPGNYLLLAIDDGWKLPRWNDAAALSPYLAHAIPITVPESGPRNIFLPEPVPIQTR